MGPSDLRSPVAQATPPALTAGGASSPPGRGDTARSVGMAAAAMAQNVVALAFTVAFAHLLHKGGYSSLSALIAALLILSLPGIALQVAAARATALGHLGEGARLAATVRGWMQRAALAAAVAAVLGAALHGPLAGLIGVHEAWAAAAVLPSACIWLALSLERGVLQGIGAYAQVGLSLPLEAAGRLVFGVGLVGLGGGIDGAFAGTPISQVLTAVVLAVVLRRRLGPAGGASSALALRALATRAWAPVIGVTLLALLQNVDVIVVKHRVGATEADAYSAAAVAGKAVMWLAVGLALFLVPETARRGGAGRDARPLLLRMLVIAAAAAVAMVAVYSLAGHLLLSVVFGARLTGSDTALPWLGIAFSALAGSYLIVQFLLALGRARFLVVLAAGSVAVPAVLLIAPARLVSLAELLCIPMLLLLAGLALIAARARARPVVPARPDGGAGAGGPPEAVAAPAPVRRGDATRRRQPGRTLAVPRRRPSGSVD